MSSGLHFIVSATVANGFNNSLIYKAFIEIIMIYRSMVVPVRQLVVGGTGIEPVYTDLQSAA